MDSFPSGPEAARDRLRQLIPGLFASSFNVPDRPASVIHDEERTVLAHCDPHRPAPNSAVLGHKAGQEVVVLATGVTFLRGNEDDLISRPLGAVPGAMLGGEDAPFVFRWESAIANDRRMCWI